MKDREYHDQFYEEEAERIFSSRLYRKLLDLHVEFLVDVTPNLEASRVVSVGCGDGRRELALAKYTAKIVGFDVSPVAIERARELAERLGIQNVEFEVGDARELERRFSAHFDAVWCPGVLHHLSDRQIDALLLSSRAALKPGGRFVSMDPSSARAVNLFKPFFRRAYRKYHSPEERELRPRDVVEKLQTAGFRDVEVRFTDWFISPLAWAFPRRADPVAPLLVSLDRLLVKTPFLKKLSSGFAVIARNTT